MWQAFTTPLYTLPLWALVLGLSLALVLISVFVHDLQGQQQDTRLFAAAIRYLDEEDQADFGRRVATILDRVEARQANEPVTETTFCPECVRYLQWETGAQPTDELPGTLQLCNHHARAYFALALGIDVFEYDKREIA